MKIIKILKTALQQALSMFVVRQRKSSFDLIIVRNKDLSYTAKIKMNNRKWYQKNVSGIYYVPDWVRPLKHFDDSYYITISKFGEGQTSIYFNVILQMFINFKRQYDIKEICGVDIYAA